MDEIRIFKTPSGHYEVLQGWNDLAITKGIGETLKEAINDFIKNLNKHFKQELKSDDISDDAELYKTFRELFK